MSDEAIDNRPLTIAREEGEAGEAARRAPLELAAKTPLISNIHEFAKISGKLVLRGASEAGLSEDELVPMRERMAKWVNIVVLYAKEMGDARRMDLSQADLTRLLTQMLRSRDEARRELFG